MQRNNNNPDFGRDFIISVCSMQLAVSSKQLSVGRFAPILFRDARVVVPYKYTFLRATVGSGDPDAPLIVRAKRVTSIPNSEFRIPN